MIEINPRVREIIEAHTLRQGPVTLSPAQSQEVIHVFIRNLLTIITLSEAMGFPQEIVAMVAATSAKSLAYFDVTPEDIRTMCAAAMLDATDLLAHLNSNQDNQ